MPTSGPYTRSVRTYWPNGVVKSFDLATWYRNGPGPYVPHPYDLRRGLATTTNANAESMDAGYWALGGANNIPSYWYADAAAVHNKCYDKFVSQVREASSQLGATATVEAAQSSDMIRRRAGQLVRAGRALKQGRPFDFFRELGVLHRRPRGLPNRSDPKKAANLWLEWHFGWSPLFQDIYQSVDVLQSPIPATHKVMARQSSGWMHRQISVKEDYSDADRWLKANYREQMVARIEVTNPNLYIATSLGLTNPAGILWEGVPFSFVVDWVIPVGSFLNSFTDFLGVAVTDQSQTKSAHYRSHYQLFNKWPPWEPWKPYAAQDVSSWSVLRATTITGPALVLRPLRVPSITRAATAISLLVQMLKSLP